MRDIQIEKSNSEYGIFNIIIDGQYIQTRLAREIIEDIVDFGACDVALYVASSIENTDELKLSIPEIRRLYKRLNESTKMLDHN